MLTFIDWFAGIGGFRRGMELAGHKCVGFCEFDKYAVASYTSMHLITEEQREYLATLPLKERQKEILKSEYRNGEWYSDDIRRVYAGDIPRADVWCFGFPCQDISIAGYGKGFQGSRSSLFFRVMYLIGQLAEEDRPKYLFIENVKNLFSVHGGWDFARVLIEMDKVGYDAEWTLLNSKDYGVPQNRERVFIVGSMRGKCEFSLGQPESDFPNRTLADILEEDVDEMYYLSDHSTRRLLAYKDAKIVDNEVTNTIHKVDGATRGTYPIVGGGGAALKVNGYHRDD